MIFDQCPDGSLTMNWDVFNSLKNLHQFDTSHIKNFFHFQTVEDPAIMPNAELAKEFTEAMTGQILTFKAQRFSENLVHFLDNYDVNLRYYNCGHLCTVPNLPMVEEAFMYFIGNKYMMRWGTCLTDESKQRDGREVQRLYSDLVEILDQNWK